MARRSRVLALLLLALALAASTNAQLPDAVKNAKVADLPTTLPAGVSIAKNKYIVQLSRPAAADRNALSRENASPESLRRGAEAQQSTFSTFVQRNKLPVKIDRKYSTLFNGVAVTVKSQDDLAKLASVAGVKRIYPVVNVEKPRPKVEAGSTTVIPQFAHALTNIDKVKKLFPELDGRGIKIGVVDTGIDWKHPAFAEPGKTCETFKGPGCRVLYGHDFVGDAYDSNNEAAVPQPDNDPMDCNGHGTHCAGISGGKDDRIEGVAPGAIFGAYRIFGCEGSTSTEIILAALEQSYQDGMSVINMSLGGGRVTDDYPTAQAVDVLSDNGVYTMSAVGNSGTGGISWVSAPGVASRGIGVASFDNTHVLAQGADVTGAGDFKQLTFAYSDAGSKFDADVPQPIIRSPNAPTAANDGCDPFPADHFKGGVALVRRGACAFTVKGVNAVNAGATGVIIYNNVPGDMAGGVVDPAQLKAPIAFISGKSGEALYAAAAKPAEVKVTFKKDLVAVPSATAGLPSGFSSWGLTQNLQMKPDVGAPGGFIYSAYPLASGGYATLSGTSMATPYMAGIAALYVQKFGESQGPESFQELQRRIHITARPSLLADGRQLAESVAKVGSGLVDGLALLTNEVDVSPSKFEFGDSPNWPRAARKSGTLTIRNNGKDTKTYRLTHTPSRAIMGEGGRATAQFGTAEVYARVTFSQPSVTLKAGAEATVRVTVDPNVPLLGKLPEPGHWQYSGYITLETEDRTNQLNVPYSVMTGDFTTFAVLPDAKSPNAPILTNVLATFPFPIPVPVYNSTVMPTFDLSDVEQTPAVKLTTLFPARRLALSVSNADSKQVVGYMLAEDYIQQLNGAGVAFNGNVLPTLSATETVPAPDGKYFISLHYTKPSLQLPTDLNAALFKAWDSPVFEIKRKAA